MDGLGCRADAGGDAGAQAASDAEKCAAAKNKVAGKYAFCRQKAEAKAIKTGDPVDYTKCNASYGTKWGSAETSGAGMCPTMGDQTEMQTCITAHTNRVAAALNNAGACEWRWVRGIHRLICARSVCGMQARVQLAFRAQKCASKPVSSIKNRRK